MNQAKIIQHTINNLPIENSFTSLGNNFYSKIIPSPISKPYLVALSEQAASALGIAINEFTKKKTIEVFSGAHILPKSNPIAAVYSGYQFGVWAGQLGDGRAILLGNTLDTKLEIQLKGSGITPYSRMGDGRAALRSSIREFLCSEAMHALGIPTTRALCVIGSDDIILRETMETCAITTRLAPSFIRFGSFEHWFSQNKIAELTLLADYVIDHFYQDARQAVNPYQAFFELVCERTANLIAQWQAVGFMHGVMNTDNMSILGLTLDYGPFGFMQAYDPKHICNHSDHSGRYAYHRQAHVALSNCYALGQALMPLIKDMDAISTALEKFKTSYQSKLHNLFCEKLGFQQTHAQDDVLILQLLNTMQKNHVDFSLFFRRLADLTQSDLNNDEPLRALFLDPADFDHWAQMYRRRLQQENSEDTKRKLMMNRVNPKYILRNHLVHLAIEKAQNKDFSELAKLLKILQNPFDDQDEFSEYAGLPPDWANDLTISCSS